jgi:mannose-1-phosphate guanylyltransferase
MDAVILAGGRGTRLLPVTTSIPKALLPLGDWPIIDVIMSQLAASGVRRVFVCLGHLAPVIQAHLSNGASRHMDVRYVVEETPLGTAGGIRQISDLAEDFLVVNGDTLTDLDFAALWRFHKEHDAWATLFTPWIEDNSQYGVVSIDSATGLLTSYEEKPRRGYHVSSGIYALSRRMLPLLPPAGHCDMPDLVRAAMHAGGKIVAYRTDAYWQDIGLASHYERATIDFQEDQKRFLR